MRILIVHSMYRTPGGENGYVRRQFDLLAKSNDVQLYADDNTQLRQGLGTAMTMAYSRHKTGEIRKVIREFAPDIVHVHNVYPSIGPAAHLATESLGVPLVMTVHNFRLRCPNGYMFTEGQLCDRCENGAYYNATLHRCFPERSQAAAYATILWTHRFAMRLEKKVRMFVTPSGFMRDRLYEWGIPEERVHMVPNFVESGAEVSSAVGSYGMYAGRLSSEKGIDVLLQALRAVGDPPFLIVGDGPLEEGLRAYAEELGLQNARFTGRLSREEVDETLKGARFLVMPSLSHENCPLAALEAMAAARPLIVTKRGGLPELVARGGGVVCEAGDPGDLAAKMKTLFEDADACIAAGEAALADATANFGPARHHDRLMEVYRSTLAMSSGDRSS